LKSASAAEPSCLPQQEDEEEDKEEEVVVEEVEEEGSLGRGEFITCVHMSQLGGKVQSE
jgi:hypothetical protein